MGHLRASAFIVPAPRVAPRHPIPGAGLHPSQDCPSTQHSPGTKEALLKNSHGTGTRHSLPSQMWAHTTHSCVSRVTPTPGTQSHPVGTRNWDLTGRARKLPKQKKAASRRACHRRCRSTEKLASEWGKQSQSRPSQCSPKTRFKHLLLAPGTKRRTSWNN